MIHADGLKCDWKAVKAELFSSVACTTLVASCDLELSQPLWM